MKLMELKAHIDHLCREGYGGDPIKIQGILEPNKDIIRPRIECGPGFTNVEIVLVVSEDTSSNDVTTTVAATTREKDEV